DGSRAAWLGPALPNLGAMYYTTAVMERPWQREISLPEEPGFAIVWPLTVIVPTDDSWTQQQRHPRRRRIPHPDRGSGPEESVRPDPGLQGRGHRRPGK